MPYSAITKLPKRIQTSLPKHAQRIYLKAFNNAWREYADYGKRKLGTTREETAHRVAWSAVKHSYEKKGKRWIKMER